jgi:branched-chain amino acid transport system substrate-binding protein
LTEAFLLTLSTRKAYVDDNDPKEGDEMLDTIRSRLWLQLSMVLGMVVTGIAAMCDSLAANGVVSIHGAFGLCSAASLVAIWVTLRVGLSSLRELADAAAAMSEGQFLMVQSKSPDDVGRIARALRSLQLSTQAAMSRMSNPDIGGAASFGDATSSWPVVVIGPKKGSWVLRFVVAGAVLAAVAGGMTAASMVTPRRAPGSVAIKTAVEAPRVAVGGATRGVSKDSITLGMSAPFSGGPARLSEGMKLGLDAAFAEVNAAGGVHGRMIKLVALDNGYEEKRAVDTTRDLVENRNAFALVGNVGTPTVKAVLPYVNERKVLLFGPLTGSPVTRNDPPDRYVFNVRTSYAAETAKMVDYLLDVKKFPGRSIIVFAQNDSYGDAGYEGAKLTLRKRGHGEPMRVGYERNTVDVADAANRVREHATSNAKYGGVKAVIVVATAAASASFTAAVAATGAKILNVSFVDATQLALEFRDRWPGVGDGVIVTQVIPHFESGATGVIRYREALKTYFPDKAPGFASLEGYVVGTLFAEGLRRAGPDLDTERLVDALEKIQDLDLGMGGALSFGVSDHQASGKVWGTMLTPNGTYNPLDAEWTE